MRISDWSSDVCSSDLVEPASGGVGARTAPDYTDDRSVLAQRRQPGAERRHPLLRRPQISRRRHRRRRRQAEPEWQAGEVDPGRWRRRHAGQRSEEHTSELQSLMRISYAVFCLKKKKKITENTTIRTSLR